jgi:iron complex transport system permease protein
MTAGELTDLTAGAAGLRTARRVRRVGVTAATGVAVVVLALVALGIGDYPLSVPQVAQALVTDQGFASTIVREWRLPRVAAALAFGAALGVSGALFQSLTRNPLGSPDVIGFSTGSYTGVLLAATVFPASGIGDGVWSLAAGLVTALLVYVLAWRRGVHGLRLIVVGIAVTAILHAFNVWLLLRAQAEVAMTASAWAAGSLNEVGWSQVRVALVALAVCGLATLAAVQPLQQLELGDDSAAAHGLRVERARLGILVLGVALTAVVTAVAGPIVFVSLAAPQVAKRMVGGAGLPLGQSALVGALLLLGADMLAQHAFPQALPVGLVTVVVGGAYLVLLLLRRTGGRR